MQQRPRAAVILGAGFSYVAGLPLTRQLFDTEQLPPSKSGEKAAFEQVANAYRQWKFSNPSSNAEVWMAELFNAGSNAANLHGTTWQAAFQFALRRLVNVKSAKTEPYYHDILIARAHPVHSRFWRYVKSRFDLQSIVSLNYDILVEQALHPEAAFAPEGRGKDRSSAPECYYGGFSYNQVVRKMTDVSSRQGEIVPLGHHYALYKLHGSITWAWEPHATTIKMHADVRAIFRSDPKCRPAIVPPLPEKELPQEFSRIWAEASQALHNADVWIVCGYSMPDYDEALTSFFRRALLSTNLKGVFIVDPDSINLAPKWSSASSPKPVCLPKLPEALDTDWLAATSPISNIPVGWQLDLFDQAR